MIGDHKDGPVDHNVVFLGFFLVILFMMAMAGCRGPNELERRVPVNVFDKR